jgi:ribosomal protein S18 acetylase RimI-like enzyme
MDDLGTLRRANDRDAPALARFAERIFRETFGADNRPEDVDAHCARSFGETLQRSEIADPAIITLVIEHEGELIAYTQLDWRSAPDCVGGSRPARIHRFYVDSLWHGTGIAQRLMEKIVAIAAEKGADRVWLAVWERNPRGIAFYRKAGFAVGGEQEFVLGSESQRDFVLVRAIDPAGSPS